MKKKILFLLPILTLLVGCNNNNPGGGETPPDPLTDEEKYNQLVEYIEESSKGCSKQTYISSQTDNYGAIELTIHSSGTLTLHTNNLMREDFAYYYEDDEANKEFAIRQFGRETIDEVDSLYVLLDHAVDNLNDTFESIAFSEENQKAILDPGYNKLFNNNIIIQLKQDFGPNFKVRIEHNLFQDLDKEAESLTLGCKIYGYEGDVEAFRYEHSSELNFENNKIVSANLVTLLSLYNDVNFKYLESTYVFEYNDLTPFEGEIIDPVAFKNSLVE